jgi:osmotically-inducible protein OsmY
VASLQLKRAAGSAAARIHGVTQVANELRVQLPDAGRRADEDLRGDVLEALMLDVPVPMTIDAQARESFVTPTGTAQWHYQREAAESRTTDVPGAAGIDNAIGWTQATDAHAAADAMAARSGRQAGPLADVLWVETSSSRLVVLSGAVSSWAAHDYAATALCAPGVTQIEDRIRVESSPSRSVSPASRVSPCCSGSCGRAGSGC